MCLSAREHISGTAGPIFTIFLCRSPVAVARSSSGGVAISYVLPVLWMTSRLAVVGSTAGVAIAERNLMSMNALCLPCSLSQSLRPSARPRPTKLASRPRTIIRANCIGRLLTDKAVVRCFREVAFLVKQS